MFKIIDTREQKGFVHDATRPFVVVETYYRGYKGGVSKMTHGRYATRKQAMRRLRTVESR